MAKYSDWFKVDLHIHTDKSNFTKKNDYEGIFNIEVLKKKLIENDVKLFSLTDHNVINIEAYKTYFHSKTDSDPNLLVGCEFDIRVEHNDSSFDTYHTLLIFNENTIEKAEEISNIIEKFFNQKSIAPKDRSLNADEIFDLFSKFNFFYIPHAGGHKNIIDAHKGDDIQKVQEMVLLMESAHEKVKEKSRQFHCDGFDKLKDPDFRNRNEEAFINFSDNHNCNNYPTPKSGAVHEFFYLKGDATFETLRLAFIDPSSRIKKHSEVERIKNVKNYIEKIEILGFPNLQDLCLELSPYLNVIIGGASSGKSLIFNLIGNKIQNKNSAFEKYNLDPTKAKIKEARSTIFNNVANLDNDEVIYINQGNIVNYFEKGDLKQLLTETAENEDYEIQKQEFASKKIELIQKLEKFKNEFEKFNNNYRNSFVLKNGDINNIQSKNFIFNQLNIIKPEIDYNTKTSLIEILNNETEKFRKDIEFEILDNEHEIIEAFQKLLIIKSQKIELKSTIQNKCKSFYLEVSKTVNQKNNDLDSNSRAKAESISNKNNLITNCKNLFEKAKTFNEISVELENYKHSLKKEISLKNNISLILLSKPETTLRLCISKCVNDSQDTLSIYKNYLFLLKDNSRLKDYATYSEGQLLQKLKKEANSIIEKLEQPDEYLDYGLNGDSKNKSPGYNSEMYLKSILQQERCKLVMIDQPEDNLGNSFKNEDLINLIRQYKFHKQIILVTHNPSIVVYGDAECIILAKNDGGKIKYEQLVLENKEYQKMIIDNLDGGKAIFDMRSRKYNIKKLLNS